MENVRAKKAISNLSKWKEKEIRIVKTDWRIKEKDGLSKIEKRSSENYWEILVILFIEEGVKAKKEIMG